MWYYINLNNASQKLKNTKTHFLASSNVHFSNTSLNLLIKSMATVDDSITLKYEQNEKSTVFGQDSVVEEICMIMQNHYISENRYYKYSYFK